MALKRLDGRSRVSIDGARARIRPWSHGPTVWGRCRVSDGRMLITPAAPLEFEAGALLADLQVESPQGVHLFTAWLRATDSGGWEAEPVPGRQTLQRRSLLRVPLRDRVEIRDEGTGRTLAGETIDISLLGMGLSLDEGLEAGRPVSIALRSELGLTLGPLAGSVAHCHEDLGTTPQTFHVGVRLKWPSEAEEARLVEELWKWMRGLG